VIHADPDNERTDPEGNSGQRISLWSNHTRRYNGVRRQGSNPELVPSTDFSIVHRNKPYRACFRERD
jgi:hypothetical protein